jgi:hypothetical protein
MTAWLREPLVHFSVLGLGLFFLHGIVGDEDELPTEIVVTEKTIEGLAHSFQGAWDRSPTTAELDELIAEYTKEEIYFRAAVAAGLDRNDPVVRRRLRQKMEFLTAEPVTEQPTGAELDRFIARHADRYRVTDTTARALEDLRERAARDWLRRRKEQANDAFYEKLRQGYSVRIERATDGA